MSSKTEIIGKYLIFLFKSTGKEKHDAINAAPWYSTDKNKDLELLEYINDNWDKHHNTK
jgi:hypothetical protein